MIVRRLERAIAAMCIAEGFNLLGIDRERRHLRLRFPAGFVTAPSTPSDRRNLLNLRVTVRRLHRA